MPYWPDNDVWEQRDVYNRSPRPAMVECEPLRPRCPRFMRFTRFAVKFVLFGGLFAVTVIGAFYVAR